jgi:hypothetical protein
MPGWGRLSHRGLLRVRDGGLFRKVNEAAYPPAAEGFAATAKSLGLKVAIYIAEKIGM